MRALRLGLFRGLVLVGVLVCLGVSATTVHAQPAFPHSAQNNIPAVEVLNPDGTLNLNKGLSGSVDLAGWNVKLEPQRGPVFEPKASATYGWSGLGYGVDGEVGSIAISGNNVYVGGSFTGICQDSQCNSTNLVVNRIAKWNGSSWSALGYGVNDFVNVIVPDGNNLYIGGGFINACGNSQCNSGNTPVNNIAFWNGSSWSALSHGLDSLVLAIAVNGSDIYVGGTFDRVCEDDACFPDGSRLNGIAKWNGSTWSALDFGLGGSVDTIAISGSNIYVGGNFQLTCGNSTCDSGNAPMNNIAVWNGSSWSALHYGVICCVSSIAINGTDIYTSGDFTYFCNNQTCDTGTSLNHIARWDGINWSSLGNGLDAGGVLAFNGNDLYIAGMFSKICGNVRCDSGNRTANSFVKWNGSSWSALQYGVSGPVDVLAVSGDDAYLGGLGVEPCSDWTCRGPSIPENHITKYSPSSCTAIPTKPYLLAPENKATINGTHVTLKWYAPNCTDTYKVSVKDAVTGEKVDSANGVRVLKYKAKTLATGKTYKWFVQACNSFGCTKSKVETFKIK